MMYCKRVCKFPQCKDSILVTFFLQGHFAVKFNIITMTVEIYVWQEREAY